ncbi:MAG: class I SAM-dependent methyltransferase [Candidatus Poribacteria bacterium]|nr:class I SAM-dependent methyltransferase [Candidatus Poribacteria bacterium]
MWDQTYLLSELPSEAETEEEVEFICETLELQRGATVLDLCCGQGRHGQLLADKGMAVIGVDSSRFLLAEAKKNTTASRNRMHLIEADMRRIPLKPVCDAVINLFTSFGFFDDDDNKRALAEVAATLKPGGKLLLDYWNPHAVSQLDGTRNWWWMSESTLALAEVEYDPESGRLSDYRTVVELATGNIRESVNRIRFYFPAELKVILESINLEVCAVYGDFDYSPFLMEGRRMITIAEKR